MKKIKIIASILMMLLWQRAFAEDESCDFQAYRVEREKVNLSKEFVRSLSVDQRIDLYLSLKESKVEIVKDDWEQIDIEEWEEISAKAPSTIMTVEK